MAYELEDEGASNLPDDLPTYEELAFGDEEWMEELANDPIPEPEPVRPPHRSGYIGLTLLLLLLIGIFLSLISHQQYDAGYANGGRDVAVQAFSVGEQQGMNIGYQDGEHQGKLEAMVGLQEWQYAHQCVVDKNGYTLLRIWRDNENRYQFECAVKK